MYRLHVGRFHAWQLLGLTSSCMVLISCYHYNGFWPTFMLLNGMMSVSALTTLFIWLDRNDRR